MIIVSQKQVDDYIKSALCFIPHPLGEQLVSMVILHFDIPDEQAKQMTAKALEGLKSNIALQ